MMAPSSREDLEHLMENYNLDVLLREMAEIAFEKGTQQEAKYLEHFAGIILLYRRK